MATQMKNRNGNLSILASFMFCLIGIMFLSPPVWGEPPVIGFTSKQMTTNGRQNLTVSGGCGEPYTWSIGSGRGSLSNSTGTSVTYTAPSSNPNCANNPTIKVTDKCGNYTTLDLAVSGYTSWEIAYTKSTGCNLGDHDGHGDCNPVPHWSCPSKIPYLCWPVVFVSESHFACNNMSLGGGFCNRTFGVSYCVAACQSLCIADDT